MKIVHVRFPGSKCLYPYVADGMEISPDEILVVAGERGHRLGSAVGMPMEMELKEGEEPPAKVIRKTTDDDLKRAQENKAKEGQAGEICHKLIGEHGLPIKLVKVEYLFDGSKIIFYFTAEGRIDFRELVRSLAHRLRTRIEMYQIGVRDEAKILGGIGICGREFCCSAFLQGFSPVSIRMAKDQGLSLNPAKVSGGCGRLLCCLAYEHGAYADFKKGLPKIGKRAVTPDGMGRVSRYDIIKKRVYVMMENGKEEDFAKEEIKTMAQAESERSSSSE